jgi:hypothetical protein
MKEPKDTVAISNMLKEQQKIINDTIEKKLSLSKLQSTIWEKSQNSGNEEMFDLSEMDEDVLKALSYRDYRSVIYILKNIYKNKTNSEYVYPIKIISKRCFEYYNNMKWNKDLDGHDIINILFTNIGNLFTKYNNINEIDMDEFISNQDFICKLWDEKIRKSIFKNIVEEVRMNNL